MKDYGKMLKINPILLSDEPTHIFNGTLVKVFPSTQFGNTATAEIMVGEFKGKWTTVYLDRAKKIESK